MPYQLQYKNAIFYVRRIDVDVAVVPTKYLDELRLLPNSKLSSLHALVGVRTTPALPLLPPCAVLTQNGRTWLATTPTFRESSRVTSTCESSRHIFRATWKNFWGGQRRNSTIHLRPLCPIQMVRTSTCILCRVYPINAINKQNGKRWTSKISSATLSPGSCRESSWATQLVATRNGCISVSLSR